MRNKLWFGLALIGSLTLLTHCNATTATSSSGGSSSSSSGPTKVENLPKATSPVEASSSASLTTKLMATTGMPLGTTTANSFTSKSSRGACEMANMTQSTIGQAAKGDRILCYIQTTIAAAKAAGKLVDANGKVLNVYDGQFHIANLNFVGSKLCGESGQETCQKGDENSGPDNIKFKIASDSTTGAINNFEMHACSGGTQNEYLSQAISGSDFSMKSKEMGSHQGNNNKGSVTVSGKLNSKGHFTGTKTINMEMTGTDDSGTYWGVLNVDQSSDSIKMTGQMEGSNAWQKQSCTYGNKVVSEAQLIDKNTDLDKYNLGLLALGDGAVKGTSSGGCGNNTWSETFQEGWNGDTTAPDSSSSYIAQVKDDTLPSSSQPSVSFSGSEDYDCKGDVEITINFAELGVNFDACSNLELNHQYIDCHNIFDSK